MMAMTLRKKKEQEKLEAAAAGDSIGETAISDGEGLSPSGPNSGVQSSSNSRRSSAGASVSNPNASDREDIKASTLKGQLHSLTTLVDAGSNKTSPVASAGFKGKARFSDEVAAREEEERGRRGRSSRTPDSNA